MYFHNNSNLSVKEDISSLTHQIQSLTFQNTLKDQEIKNLLKETKKEKEQLASLKYKIYLIFTIHIFCKQQINNIFRKHIKDVEDKVRNHQTLVSSLQDNIRTLKFECKQSTSYKLEADDLKKELEKYQS